MERCKQCEDYREIIDMQEDILKYHRERVLKCIELDSEVKDLKKVIKRYEKLLKRANQRWVNGAPVDENVLKEMREKGQI